MKYYVKDRGLEEQYYIDSAGISGYHSGDPADRRMQSHAIRRGYDLTSLSRKFYPDATRIFITHRENCLELFDRVVFIENGEIFR